MPADDFIEDELYGQGLLGESLAPRRSGNLAERFILPPFSVLSAREGWWQERKRAWLALGIKSELGRGGETIQTNAVNADALANRGLKDKAAPGRSLLPAMNYSGRERGTGTGTAISGTAARVRATQTQPLAILPPEQQIPLTDPFLAAYAARLDAAGEGPLVFDEATWGAPGGSSIGIDVECFPNFFLVCFQRFSDGARLAFELCDRAEPLQAARIKSILEGNTIVSFNGNAYDLPMVYLALGGASNAALKAASDRIVTGGIKPWEVEKALGVRVPRLNHVDLMEPNPSVRGSLKLLHARLHGRFLVDLPYESDTWLSPREMNVVTLYCFNDLDATSALRSALSGALELRVALGREHGMDLRSKSDAQIGEAIVKKRVEEVIGRRLPKTSAAPVTWRYEVPTFVRFEGERLRQIVADLAEADFHADGTGKIRHPEMLDGLVVAIGATEYAMGVGGLHSTEAHRALRSDEANELVDVDVASHYPSIVMKLGLYPAAMGPAFLDVYGGIIRDRLAAKAAGDKVRSDGGKIILNGSGFGKTGSVHSVLYAPHMLMAITLTGQLSILMLIERAEFAAIPVVSSNTDGVVFFCPRARRAELDAIVAGWEAETGFATEKTRYRALYSASVNTYIAVKEDGTAKRKGAIADPWGDGDVRAQLQKNPQMTICSEAVLRFVVDGTPIAETVARATNPRTFITVIRVNGGALWRDRRLGRVVRWYWSTDGEPVVYADGSNRKVAKTDGARPLLELTDTLPPDLDRPRYVAEAERLAIDLGITDGSPSALGALV